MYCWSYSFSGSWWRRIFQVISISLLMKNEFYRSLLSGEWKHEVSFLSFISGNFWMILILGWHITLRLFYWRLENSILHLFPFYIFFCSPFISLVSPSPCDYALPLSHSTVGTLQRMMTEKPEKYQHMLQKLIYKAQQVSDSSMFNMKSLYCNYEAVHENSWWKYRHEYGSF